MSDSCFCKVTIGVDVTLEELEEYARKNGIEYDPTELFSLVDSYMDSKFGQGLGCETEIISRSNDKEI